jgi:predicted Zn-dependent protease
MPSNPSTLKRLTLLAFLVTAITSTFNRETLAQPTPVSTNHYLSNVLLNGKVIHWNLSYMPLKVYITPANNLPNWSQASNTTVEQALTTWSQALNGKVFFKTVSTPQQADIVVKWQPQLPAHLLGQNPFKAVNNKILQSDITLATHHPTTAAPLTLAQLKQTAIHELGHALGLMGHSSHPQDRLYSHSNPLQTQPLTQRDINTIRLLYSTKADITNDAQPISQVQQATTYALKVQQLLTEKQAGQALIIAQQGLQTLNKPDQTLLSLAATAAQQANQPTQAELYYRQLLRLNPAHTQSQFNLACLVANKGRTRLQQGKNDATTHQHLQEAIARLKWVKQQPKAPANTQAYLSQTQKLLNTLLTTPST